MVTDKVGFLVIDLHDKLLSFFFFRFVGLRVSNVFLTVFTFTYDLFLFKHQHLLLILSLIPSQSICIHDYYVNSIRLICDYDFLSFHLQSCVC